MSSDDRRSLVIYIKLVEETMNLKQFWQGNFNEWQVFGEYWFDESTIVEIKCRVEHGWVPLAVMPITSREALDYHRRLDERFGKDKVFHYQYSAWLPYPSSSSFVQFEAVGINVYFVRKEVLKS